VFREDRITITTLTAQTYGALVNKARFQDSLRVIALIFEPDGFEELARRYRLRGDTEEFIERRRIDFPKAVELVNNAPRSVERVVVRSGEYLADALMAHGIILRPGKSEKNYL
jgi:hypothetical protein